MNRIRWLASVAACAMLGVSCEGRFFGSTSRDSNSPFSESGQRPDQIPGQIPGIGAPSSPSDVPVDDTFGRGVTGIHRLTRREYTQALKRLIDLDLTREIEATIPSDSRTPFDNDYARQEASKPLIEGYQVIAEEASARLLADSTKLARVVGCTPKTQTDAECFKRFLESFGRRAFRRPLRPEELTTFSGLLTSTAAQGNFNLAIGLALRSMLQSVDFLYRVELGAGSLPSDRVVLTPFELASRLSLTLWGELPDDTLLDAAQQGQLDSSDGLRAQATRLIDAPAGRAHLARFHAQLWLYDAMQISGQIAGALRQETDALIERVVFERQSSWTDLFRSKQTYVNDALRTHYGLPAKAGSGFEWVDYPRADQMGILSHGSVLSNGVSGNDTSPVFRGKFVREHLMCQTLPAPPVDVMASLPKTSENLCKPERFAEHSGQDKCRGCHSLTDGIGFGLENYDAAGRYRDTEPMKANCKISGEGELLGVGTFKGPAGLAELLLRDEKALSHCMLEGLYGYTIGRTQYTDADRRNISALSYRFGRGSQNLRQLIIDWVSDDSFRTRDIDTKDR